MNEPLIQKQDNQASEKFRLMADAIDHNATASFGGAVVIVPPFSATAGQTAQAVEFLLLDSSPAAIAQFWSTVKTRIEMALDEIRAKEQATQAFGRR